MTSRAFKVYPFPNERLVDLLYNNIMPNGKSSEEAKDFFLEARSTVATYPKKLQEALVPLLENDPDRHHYIFLVGAIEEDVPHVVISEYVAYHEHVAPSSVNTYLLGALRHYPQLPELDNYSNANDDTRETINALLTVTARLEKENTERRLRNNVVRDKTLGIFHGLPLEYLKPKRVAHGLVRAMVISSEPLVQLIVDNPDKADHIADIVIDRDTVDVPFIDSIINSSTVAVSTGTL